MNRTEDPDLRHDADMADYDAMAKTDAVFGELDPAAYRAKVWRELRPELAADWRALVADVRACPDSPPASGPMTRRQHRADVRRATRIGRRPSRREIRAAYRVYLDRECAR